jgi:hypothetical protein
VRSIQRDPQARSTALAGAAIVGLIVWSGQAPVPFIYFQF